MLGPVGARLRGVGLDLGGSKPCGLLAMLLLSPSRPVSVATLTDGLWADDAPRTAGKMLQVYVSRIRHQLGDASHCLRTTPAGYLLRVDDDAVDLARFQELTARADMVGVADPASASTLLAEALELWHGPALANVRTEPFADAAVARLDELRMTALEARIDADLAAGRHRAVVAELQQLVVTHQTREHLGAQLMLALYRSGRQAEALAAATVLRHSLDDDLGIIPGPAIAQLEVAILRQDSSLDLPAGPSRPDPRPQERSEEPSAPGPHRTRPRRVRWTGLAVFSLVACTALGAAVIGSTGGGSPTDPRLGGVAIKPASLLVMDGGRESVLVDVPLGGQPDRIAVAGDSAWVSNRSLRTVTQVELPQDAVGETVGLAAWPSDLAANGSDVWVSNAFLGTVTHMFASSGQVTTPTYPDGDHPGLVALATDEGHLYSGLPDGRLVTLSLPNLRVVAQTRLRDRVAALADDGSTLCARYFRASAVDCMHAPELSVSSTMVLPSAALALTCTDDEAWALAGSPASIWQLPLTGHNPVTRLRIPAGATALAASSSYLWVLYGDRGRLLRLPLAGSGPPVTVDLGRPAKAIETWHDQVIISLA